MSEYADLSWVWKGAADRLRAKVEATSDAVLIVEPLEYWAAIAEGLPEAEWTPERHLVLAGVTVEPAP